MRRDEGIKRGNDGENGARIEGRLQTDYGEMARTRGVRITRVRVPVLDRQDGHPKRGVRGSAAPSSECALASATSAAACLSRVEAILAIHGSVPAGFKGNRGLLSATGADDACPSGFGALISATAAPVCLFILLRLAAVLAAFRGGIPTLAEKVLIFACKCECLSAVAAGEFLIRRHIFPFVLAFAYAEF